MDYGILSRGFEVHLIGMLMSFANLKRAECPAATLIGLYALIMTGCMPVQPITPQALKGADAQPPPKSISGGVLETAPTATQLPDAHPIPAGAELAHVVRVIDGDTIEVEMNGQNYRVRYIGMNTAETNQICGSEGTEANAALVADQDVTMVKDVSETDRYGRLLRYVYVGELFVNAELVRQGVAEAATYPPDVAHVDEFVQLAAEARDANLGCWSTDVWQDSDAPQPTRSVTTQGTGADGPCDCSGRDLNCSAFDTHDEAQACFDHCMAEGFGDTFSLDGNSDNEACESLP
jgi:endonuclease YncB( thermonuclease family)